jgi:hypothetical protein
VAAAGAMAIMAVVSVLAVAAVADVAVVAVVAAAATGFKNKRLTDSFKISYCVFCRGCWDSCICGS